MTAETLERLHRHELPPAELLAVVRHLERCSECARRADPALPPRLILADERGAESAHLDPETELFPWVDGTLHAADREIVESHLEECPVCRAEAEDLRRMRRPERRVLPRWAAMAAGLVLVVAGLVAIRRPAPVEAPLPSAAPPPVATSTAYADAGWTRLVEEAVRTKSLPLAEGLAALRPAADPLRGGPNAVQRPLWPAGVVVADARPRFTWTAAGDATYVVFVFDGPSEVAASGVLTEASWTPPVDLPEGRTLAWQVEVTREGRRFLMPAPPAPPALFRVASREDRDEIETARARHPHDHLLHAVLYARAGLVAEAHAALQRAVAAGDPRARAISAR